MFNLPENANQNSLNDFDSVKNIFFEIGLNLIPINSYVLELYLIALIQSKYLVLPEATDIFVVLNTKKKKSTVTFITQRHSYFIRQDTKTKKSLQLTLKRN